MSDTLGYISLGTQALSSGIGGLFTNHAIKKENQKNREWNEKMWNMTNQYNSPKEQMKRYLEAGLNPNLIYGSAQNSLASYAGNLGTSENFENPTKNVNFLAMKQFQQQDRIIDSQVEVNEAKVQDLLASKEEKMSRISANFSQNGYIQAATQLLQNQDEFYKLSRDTQYNILGLQQALLSENVRLAFVNAEKVVKETWSIEKLANLREQSVTNSIALAWKKFELDTKEVIARIETWAKQGDAALIQAKAAMLNSITGSKLFDLQKDKFDTFSDVQKSILQQQLYKLQNDNSWNDIFNEVKYKNFQIQGEYQQKQIDKLQNDLDNYYLNMMLDFTKSALF